MVFNVEEVKEFLERNKDRKIALVTVGFLKAVLNCYLPSYFRQPLRIIGV